MDNTVQYLQTILTSLRRDLSYLVLDNAEKTKMIEQNTQDMVAIQAKIDDIQASLGKLQNAN